MTEELDRAVAPQKSAGGISKKMILAVVIVLLIILASGIYLWSRYFSNWSIEEVEDLMINDPTEMSQGFKHSLAGKQLTVEGEVTNVTLWNTNQGVAYFVELDGFDGIYLIYWDQFPHEIGDRIEDIITFEWSTYNDERHVYSPQLSMPGIATVAGAELYVKAIEEAFGFEMVPGELPNGDIKIMVSYSDAPIPVGISNCSLRDGRHSGQGDMNDVFGWYGSHNNVSDDITPLTAGTGPNGTLRYFDNDSDGYLDTGDYFTLHGLAKPLTETGIRTYMLVVEWDDGLLLPEGRRSSGYEASVPCYVVMKREGLVTTVEPAYPGGQIKTYAMAEGVKFEIQHIHYDGYPSWDDSQITLLDGTSFAQWNISSAPLNVSHTVELALETKEVGDIQVSCRVTDVQGNGRVDALDFWTFQTEGSTSFNNNSYYDGALMHKPSRMLYGHANFRWGVSPVSNMTHSAVSDGERFVFGSTHIGYNMTYSHVSTSWDEVRIELNDGNNTVLWSPSMSTLRAGDFSSQAFAAVNLSNITVFCNVTDINGDGYVSIGDQFTIRVGGPEEFLASEIYTVKVVYEPVPGDMFAWSFAG